MKKILKIIIIPIIIFSLLPINANAQTLGELRAEYDALEKQYSDKNSEIQYTEDQINDAKNRIESIYVEVAEAEEEIQGITNEIAKLNEQINEKDGQIKELMKFLQVTRGESTYLEYIFKAKSITDFIYRITVTQQLSKYNTNLINEMHDMIEKNNKNIEALHQKQNDLKELQIELSEKLEVLRSQRESLHEESMSIEEEIETAKVLIDRYSDLGCDDDEDIYVCANKHNQLPPGTKFYRPIVQSSVTDEYGWRICPFHGPEIHSGIDISGWDRTIYAISDGKVAYTGYNSSMGNYIVIDHNINGQNYSSVYMHIDWGGIFVSEGEIVTKDTVIARMGTTGSSTGNHLHLSLYVGLYLRGGYLVNPRDYINFPSSMYTYWYDRTSYYQ